MNSAFVSTSGSGASPKTIKRRRQRQAAKMRERKRISDSSGSDSQRENEVRSSLGSQRLTSASPPTFSDHCRLEDDPKTSCTSAHSGQTTAKVDHLATCLSQPAPQSDHLSAPSASESQFYGSNQMGNAINPTLGDMYVDGRQGPSPPKIAALNQSAASTIPYMSNNDAPSLRRKSPHKSGSPETAHAIKLARKWLGPYTEDPVFAEDLDFILDCKVLTLREDVRFLRRDGQRISLGTGLYSSVYLARNCSNRKLLAVKMLDSAMSSRARAKDPALARTVVLDEAMKHYYASSYSAFFPRFVGIVQSSPGDYIGIAMEFVGMDSTSMSSLTLLKALARSDQLRLTRKDLADIFSQVAQGMTDLHNAGMTFNDIHFGNILIQKQAKSVMGEGEWRAFIIDVGRCLPIGHPTVIDYTKYEFGPHSIFAPELFEKDGTHESHCDMFTFGRYLNELVASRPELDASLFKCIGDRCSAVDPGKRYECFREVKLYFNALRNYYARNECGY